MSLALLVGDRHSGKTTTCRRLAERMCARGSTAGGIIAPAVHEAGGCVGYDVVDLANGRSTRLATIDGPGTEQVGRFHFLPAGLAFGKAALEQAAELTGGLVIVDEVGPLELEGGGWCQQLDQLADRRGLTLLTVRRSLAVEVARRWNAPATSLHDLVDGPDAIIARLIRMLEGGMLSK